MVAIGAGTGVGLERSSASILGARGQIGSPSTGRAGDNVFVNAANGNLVITRQDEFLVGLGPDVAVSRTYNSQASVGDGDNNDQWRMSPYRQIIGTNGAANVTRVDWDGSETVYFQYAANSYETNDGAGAHDTLSWTGTQWIWTDANSRIKDTYDSAGKLITTKDSDGNTLTYTYSGSLIASVTDQNGERTDFVYGGTGGAQLQQITTVAGSSSVRVRYTYDVSNRLSTVIVDLSPGDGSIADGKTYVTTYTYDGTSKRVASIAQSDGSLLQIGYAFSGTEYRVVSLTETVASGVTRVTGLFYDMPNQVTRITDPAGGVTAISYDAKGNLTQIVMPTPVPGAAAPTTAFTYAANGDVLSMTENGRRTDYEYNPAGNMTRSRDAAGNTVVRTYDARNQLLTSTLYLVPDPDGAGTGAATTPVTTRYAYDAALESHLRFAISAEGDVIEYQYNAAGQLLSTIAYTAQKYDVSALASDVAPTEAAMAAWAAAIADKSTVRRTDTTYNGRGNVATVTRYSAASAAGAGLLTADYSRDTYVYSPAGQLLSRVNSGSAAQEVFVYDGLGRLTSATDMANATTTFLFNDAAATTAATLASGLTRVAAYNKAGELISVTESGANVSTAITNYYYDGLGRLRMETNPNGTATYHVYDNASRKVADITTDGAMTEYAYDVSGRPVKTVGYVNKLSAAQVALLDNFTAGGSGGAIAGSQGIGGAPTGSSLIVNGGFETSGTYTATTTGRSNTTLPSWIKVNSETFEQVTSGQMGVTASEGTFWLDLESVAGTGNLLTTGSNLVLNGSFETSGSYVATATGRSNTTLPNWAKANAETFEQVTSGQMGVAASDGSYWLDMESVAKTGLMVVGSNLLGNGSFETSGSYVATATGRSNTTLPNWTKANSETFEQVTSGQMGVTATNGAYWLDLESTASPGPQPVGSNLVVNGSFEQSTNYTQTGSGRSSTVIPGWNKTNPEVFDQVLAETTSIEATDGVYWLDLDSVAASASEGPNLLVNGSFEQSATTWTATTNGRMNSATQNIPGWVKANSQGFEQMNSGALGVAATDGSFYLDMESASGAGSQMDISQTVTGLTAGQQLTLKFDYANIAGTVLDVEGNPENSGALEVYWNGLKIGIVTAADTAMTTRSFTVSSIAGNNTLRFKEIGVADGKGVYLDNVRLFTNVPATGVGNMVVYQTIPNLTAGQVMQLQFDYSSRTSATSGSFEVYWNTTLVATVSDGGGLMKSKTYFVNAAAGNNTITFKGIGTVDGLGGAIDNVRLFATQTPPHGGNMDISQTVGGLTAGQILQLQFDHANRTTAASGSFEVYWNGALVATVTDINTVMQTKTYQLTAVAGTNTLRFKSTGTVDAAGASLDNVRLFAMAPVPSGGNMDISQTVGGLTAGQTMQLQFDHANRTTAASGSFEVYWNNALVATVNSTGTAMQTKTYLVTAIAGNNTLRFKSLGTVDDAGASIDNVRLFATYTDVGGGNMDVSQTVGGLTAGQNMLLQFDHANRTSAASGSFEVYWNGALVATVNSTGTTMLTKNYHVTAIAGNNTLRFKGTGTVDAAGASIDNVRLFATQANSGGTGGPVIDALAGLRPVAHADDRYQWNVYDSASRLVETIDGAGAVTLFSYDGASRHVQTKSFANLLAAATVTAYKSTTPTAVALPTLDAANDRVARSFYDKEGLLIGTLDGEGYLTENVYDGADLLIETIRYATQTAAANRASGSFAILKSGVASPVNPKDIHNWYVYDGRGLLRGVIDGEGDLTRYHYTPGGYVDQEVRGQKLDPAALMATRPTFATLPTAAGGQVTETTSYTRDGAGKVLGEARLLTDGSSWTTVYGYDVAGRLTSRADASATADARTFTQRYDARGNLIGELSGEGSAALAALGASPTAAAVDNVYATRGTIYTYDAADRLVAVKQSNGVNAAGNRTLYYYTATDRLAFQVNALGEVVEYRYNARGERTDTIAYGTRIAAGTLPGLTGGQVTAAFQTVVTGITNASLDSLSHADYNVTGTVKQSVDPLTNVVTYSYNAFRELKSRVDPLDASTSVQTDRLYDRRGLLVSEKKDAAAGGLQLETVYGHDAFGRPSQVTDPAGRVRKTGYDRAGRVALTTDARNMTQAFSYDGRGNVLTLTDRTGAVTSFSYDAFSRTMTSTTPGSVVTTVKHNAHGDTISIKDGALRETVYTYDKDGNLKTETNAASNLVQHNYDAAGRLKETIDARGSKTSYSYDSANRVLTEKVNDGGLNLVTAYEYDAKGRTFKITDPANRVTLVEFDRNGRRTAVVVNSGGLALRTEYGYDKSGRLLTVTEGAGTAVARVTQYEYDKADRLLRSRVDPAGLNLLTQYSYDKAGNVARKTDAAGFLTTYSYDAENRLTRSLNAENGVVETFYDNEGRVAATRQYANAGSAAAGTGGAFTISVTADNARDHVAGYVYDAGGRLRFAVEGTGRPTEYVYDGAGNVIRSITYAGNIAYAVGDSLATIQSRVAALVNLVDNRTTRAAYDAANRQAFTIDAAGGVTAFTYDGNGNITKQIRYASLFNTAGDQTLAAMQTWVANNANATNDRVSRTFYDGASRATFLVDAENYVTQYQYDAAARVTKQIRHAGKTYSTGDGTTEAGLAAQIGAPQTSAAVTGFTYDTAGRLTDTTDPVGNVTHLVLDALGQATDTIVAYNVPADTSTTRRVFDKAGRVQSETRAYGTAEATTTGYVYDGMDRARFVTDGRNVTTEYIYDGLGHCVHEVQPLNATQTAHIYKDYDKFGNLVKLTDPRGNAAFFHYDALDRLVWQTDPEGYVTKTTYTVGDEPASVTRYAVPVSGTTTAAPPAVTANTADATTTFTRDKLDRLKAVTDAETYTETYALNAFGDRTSVTNKINGTTVNTFDKRGLLLTETLPVGSTRADGTIAAANIVNKYDYDARGNRITKTEAFGIVGEQRVTNFVYDKADRLKQKSGASVYVVASPVAATGAWTTPTENFNYDARGNHIETTTSWGARTLSYYDDLGRKTAEIETTSSATLGTLSKWDYDDNGNVVAARIYTDPFTLPAAAGGPAPTSASSYRQTLYTYDSNNRLTHSRVAGMRSGEYGASYVSAVGDIVLETVYDLAGNVVQEKDGRLNSVFSFYNKAGRKIARVDQERYLTFYTLDGEGNVKTEERFADQLASVAITSDPAALRASVLNGAGNRVTQFTYDKNGRRKSETRLNVNGKSLSATGQLQAAGANAQILYDYNGLGQVTRKTEANLDVTEFGYDLIGRQTSVQSALYTDYLGASVRRRTETAYNGLGNVTRSVDKGKTAAKDRVTTYTYGPGGRLDQVKDAADFVRTYSYDAAGNVVREAYSRVNSANVATTEANGYRYDLRNRVVSQSVMTLSGSVWSEGDVTSLRYNAFGEISGRGVNVVGNGYQETFDYDSAGRMWRSTEGDGSVRLYAHDKAGNANLVIASAGNNLAGLSLDSALAAYAGGGGGVAATVTLFDKRGQTTGTIELQRQLAQGTTATLSTSRLYNAFGEVRQETDARGKITDYSYNTAGKLTKLEKPTVDNRTATGALLPARPTENYSYDLAGRLIGAQNANNNLITYKLLAGTGYGDEEAVVLAEYLPDGINAKGVDEFGDVRTSTDATNRTTGYTYDKMGRVTQINHAGSLIDYYGYDGLGQRIVHTNNVMLTPIYGPSEQIWVEDPPYWDNYYGWVYPGTGHYETYTPIIGHTPDKETTDYDRQGRVTRQVAFGGDVTTTAYVWDGSISTAGLGTFGGWITTTTYANTSLDLIRRTDLFGRETARTDLGDHSYSFSYDAAGRLAQRSGGGTLTYTYFNTGLLASVSDGAGGLSSYGYDAGGNKTSEYTQKNYAVVQSATAAYDALGRMISWNEAGAAAGNATTPASSTAYEYDLVGNIRHTTSTQVWLDQNGAPIYSPVVHYWYQYDALNRVTTDKGAFVGTLGSGYISGGTSYTYDAAGRRVTASSTVTRTKTLHRYVPSLGPSTPWYYDESPSIYPDDGGGTRSIVQYSFTSAQIETYSYDAAGNLQGVTIAVQDIEPIEEWGTTHPQVGALTATPRAAYERDAMGRLKRQTDRKIDGTIVYDRIVSYDASGRISGETVNSLIGTDTWVSTVTNNYGSGAGYALGAPVVVTTSDSKNGAFQHSTTTTNSYAWWEGAALASTSYAKTGQTTFTTSYYYDAAGQLTSLYIGDARARTVTFTTDMNGQVIRRDELDYTSTTNGDPHEVWYRFNGKQIAYSGNNGTLETDYETSITNRGKASVVPGGAFRWGASSGPNVTDYDPGFDPINSYEQGSSGGGYTIRAGDTLAGIAASLWGDSSLWYKLAEANGLTSASTLVEGQNLMVPIGVQANGHSASTFKPYDPGEVLGDTSPTTPTAPKPQKGKNKCGLLGTILLIAVAVAITVILKAPVTGLFTSLLQGSAIAGAATVLGAAATGAIASVVSQGVGLATGIQKKFSWKGVAMSALSAGITQGVGNGTLISGAGKFANDVARGALVNAATQGVAVATGLQKKFDWAGIAVAGVVSGVTGAISRALPNGARDARVDANGTVLEKAVAASRENSFASSLGGAIAGAGVRSVLTGTSFGDNLLAVLPDVIGATIGNMIGEAINEEMARKSKRAAGTGEPKEPEDEGEAIEVTGSRQPNVLTDPLETLLNLPEITRFDFEGLQGGLDLPAMDRRVRELRAEAALAGGDDDGIPDNIGLDSQGRRWFTLGNAPYYQVLMAMRGATGNLEAYEGYTEWRGSQTLANEMDDELRTLIFRDGESWEGPSYAAATFFGSEGSRLIALGGTYPNLGALGQELVTRAREYRAMGDEVRANRLARIELTIGAAPAGRSLFGINFNFSLPDHVQLGGYYLGREGIDLNGIVTARNGRYGLFGTNGLNYNSNTGNWNVLGVLSHTDGNYSVLGGAFEAGNGRVGFGWGAYQGGNGRYSVAFGAARWGEGDYSFIGGLVEGGNDRFSLFFGGLERGPDGWSLGRTESSSPTSRLTRGIDFEAQGTAAASREAFAPGRSTQRLSVRAFDDNGRLMDGRTVLDQAGYRADNGIFDALEFKLSPDAPYTRRQLDHFPNLARNGGIVVGTNGESIGLPAGTRLAPFEPNRINGPTPPGPNEWWRR